MGKGFWLVLFSFLAMNMRAQVIDDIHYQINENDNVQLFYRVIGESQDSVLQLRIIYSTISRRGQKQWYTLSREYLTVQDGYIHWLGNIELNNFKKYIETSEIQFELINGDKIIHNVYYTTLLDGAYEIEPQVFVPIASEKPKEEIVPPPPPPKPMGENIMFGGYGIRGLTGRRIVSRCNDMANLRFEQEGVAWIYVGVTEKGYITNAIFTVQTTSGEQSTITDPEQKKMARACAKEFRFAPVRSGTGTQYGFVSVYFNKRGRR